MKNLSLLSFCFVLFFTACNIDDDLIQDYQEPSITIQNNSGVPVTKLILSENYKFSATFLNDVGASKNELITWQSSDESVITINSNGLAMAIGLGTSEISATAINNNPKTKVKTPISKVVTSITINEVLLIENTISEIALNDTYRYNVKYFGEETITWTSSDSSKATIDNEGVITAIRLGQVTISASVTENGKTYSVETMATVTGVTLRISNPITTSLVIGKTHKYLYEFSESTIPTITWKSSDTSIATIDSNGLVTAVAAGNTTITATTVEGGETIRATTSLEIKGAASKTGTLSGSYSLAGTVTLTSTSLSFMNFVSTAPDTHIHLTNNPSSIANGMKVSGSNKVSGSSFSLALDNIDINNYTYVVAVCERFGNIILGHATLN